MSCPVNLAALPSGVLEAVCTPENLRVRTSTMNSLTPLSFPKSRSALWDGSPAGEKLRLQLCAHRKPRLVLLEKALRLAQRHARHSNKPRLLCFLLGSLSVDEDEQGVTLTLDRFDPGRDQAGARVPSAPLPGDVPVPCLFSTQTESDGVVQSEAELHHCFKALQQCVSSRQTLDVSQLIKVRGHVVCRQQSDAAAFSLSWSAVCPSSSVDVQPVRAVPVIPTALLRSLTGAQQPHAAGRQRGFLTMDQTRKLLLLLESDPKASSLPLVGLWLSGVTHVHHPQVWAWCLRFLYSSALQDRVLSERRCFLLVLFGSTHRTPQFFQCRGPEPGLGPGPGPQLDYQLLSASQCVTLYQQVVSVEGQALRCDLGSEVHSRQVEVFREAQTSFSRAAGLSINDQDSGVEDEDLSPRPSPSPHPPAQQTRRVQPSVPELSLLIDGSFSSNQSGWQDAGSAHRPPPPPPAVDRKCAPPPPRNTSSSSSSAPRPAAPPHLHSTPNSHLQQPCTCCSTPHTYDCTSIFSSPGLPTAAPAPPPAASSHHYHHTPPPSNSHASSPSFPPSSLHPAPPPPSSLHPAAPPLPAASSHRHHTPPPPSSRHHTPPPPSSHHHHTPPLSKIQPSTPSVPPPSGLRPEPSPPSSYHHSPPPSSLHPAPLPAPSSRHNTPPPCSSHPSPPPPPPLSSHLHSPPPPPCQCSHPPPPPPHPVSPPWFSRPSCVNQCCDQVGGVLPSDTYQLLLHQDRQLRLLQAQVQMLLEAQGKLQTSSQQVDTQTARSTASIAVGTGASLFWGNPVQPSLLQQEAPPSSPTPPTTSSSSSSCRPPSHADLSVSGPVGGAEDGDIAGQEVTCSPSGHSVSGLQSPVLGESVSMYRAADDQSQQSFYHNLMNQLTSRLQEAGSKQEVEEEESRRRSLSVACDRSGSSQSSRRRRSHEDPVFSATVRQLEQLGVDVDGDDLTAPERRLHQAVESASTLASISPAAVLSQLSVSEPTASSLFPGGSVDLSLEANAIALRYLSDSQLSRMSLGGHAPHPAAAASSSSCDSLLSSNNMSMATRKYMRRYGLIEEEEEEEDEEARQPLTEALNVKLLPQSQLIRDLRPKMQLLNAADKENCSGGRPSLVRASSRQTEGSVGNILDLSRLRQLPKLF